MISKSLVINMLIPGYISISYLRVVLILFKMVSEINMLIFLLKFNVDFVNNNLEESVFILLGLEIKGSEILIFFIFSSSLLISFETDYFLMFLSSI